MSLTKVISELSNELFELECAAVSKENLTSERLYQFLAQLNKSFRFNRLYDSESNHVYGQTFYTRIAQLLTVWLINYKGNVDFQMLYKINSYKPVINCIFYASGFAGTQHLINYITTGASVSERNFSLQKFLLFVSFTHIDDLSDELRDGILSLADDQRFVIIMGMLNCSTVLTDQGEKNRSVFIERAEFISNVVPDNALIDSFFNAWMYCSYSTFPQKHQLKLYLNKMLGNYWKQYFSSNRMPAVRPAISNAGQVLLVVLERFRSSHAMFRCYEPVIRQLAQHFKLVALVEEEQIDDLSASLFSDVIKVANYCPNISQALNAVEKIQPDLIYYPSIGMSRWTILLANLRLAPVQFMSLGHPASSFSTEIDYVQSMGIINNDVSAFSETVLFTQSYGYRAVSHPLLQDFSGIAEVEKSKEYFDIALNCTGMKLNSFIFDTCEKILASTEKKVRFNFFPGQDGITYDGVKRMILRAFPDAVVNPAVRYDEFLERLKLCHLSLAPYPFGNANSTVDALVCGIPVVCLTGNEPASLTDQYVLKSSGMGDDLICANFEEYITTTMKLINDAEYYEQIVREVKQLDLANTIFNADNRGDADEIANIIKYVSDNHDLIKESGVKYLISSQPILN